MRKSDLICDTPRTHVIETLIIFKPAVNGIFYSYYFLCKLSFVKLLENL